MNKTLRLIALLLAFSCLFSITAFATTYDEDDYIEIWPSIIPGDVNIMLKAEAPKVDNYATLLPELKISRIDRIYHWDDGRVELRVVLTELTVDASLAAVTALQNNQYVESASECWMSNGLWEDPPIMILKGDVNNDNERTNSDLVIVAQFIVYSEDNRAHILKSADINNDGFITNIDLVIMARMVVGLE